MASLGTAVLFCLVTLLTAASANAEALRYVPATWQVEASRHWLVGVVLERTVRDFHPRDIFDGQLVGLSASSRWNWFEAGGKLEVSLKLFRGIEKVRGLLALGLAASTRLAGIECTYGIGVQTEARLADHYWLVHLTPAELGAIVWDAGSWRVRLSMGPRVLVAGRLINTFLLDPNGFDDEHARMALHRQKQAPWDAFFRITFARRID